MHKMSGSVDSGSVERQRRALSYGVARPKLPPEVRSVEYTTSCTHSSISSAPDNEGGFTVPDADRRDDGVSEIQ